MHPLQTSFTALQEKRSRHIFPSMALPMEDATSHAALVSENASARWSKLSESVGIVVGNHLKLKATPALAARGRHICHARHP